MNGPKHPGAVGLPPARITPPPPAVPDKVEFADAPSWRQLLVEQGPDAWTKAIRAHPGVLLTDTTW